MTFKEWKEQSSISFEDWFIHEWNDGWLRSDEGVSKYLVENYQEEYYTVIKENVLQPHRESVFKIQNRYFRLHWSVPNKQFPHLKGEYIFNAIEEVQKKYKDISIEYYEPI